MFEKKSGDVQSIRPNGYCLQASSRALLAAEPVVEANGVVDQVCNLAYFCRPVVETGFVGRIEVGTSCSNTSSITSPITLLGHRRLIRDQVKIRFNAVTPSDSPLRAGAKVEGFDAAGLATDIIKYRRFAPQLSFRNLSQIQLLIIETNRQLEGNTSQ